MWKYPLSFSVAVKLWGVLLVLCVRPTYCSISRHETISKIYDMLNVTSPDAYRVSGTNVTISDMCYYLLSLNGIAQHDPEPGAVYCNRSWDGVDCWPATPAGIVSTQPCPAYIDGIIATNNATRECSVNGTWASHTNYGRCLKNKVTDTLSPVVRSIYLSGFAISTAALIAAMTIFCYFRRSLRCLRNVIHCHLIMTFIIKNLIYFFIYFFIPKNIKNDQGTMFRVCKASIVALNYIQETNFFWMFVEGLYLHTIIVWAYSADKIKTWHYCFVGWGIPVIFIVSWVVVKIKFDDNSCWLPQDNSLYDLIVVVPIFVVLGLNVIFLASIIWVLVTKLRASHTLESNQYRKIVKATVVLVPLLGITYIIFLAPVNSSAAAQSFYDYANAVSQSLQGFVVALFYCFLNGEVQTCIRNRFRSWNESRSIACRNTRNTSLGFQYTCRASNGDVTRIMPIDDVTRDDTQTEVEHML